MEPDNSQFEEVGNESGTQPFLHEDALDDRNLSTPPPFGTGSPAADVRKSLGFSDAVCDYVPGTDTHSGRDLKKAGVMSSCFRPATHLAYLSQRYPAGLGLDEDPYGRHSGKDHNAHYVCAEHAQEAADELNLDHLEGLAAKEGVDIDDLDHSKIYIKGRAEPLANLSKRVLSYFRLDDNADASKSNIYTRNIRKYTVRRRGTQTPSAEEMTIPQVPDENETPEDFYERRQAAIKKRSNYLGAINTAFSRLRSQGVDVGDRGRGRNAILKRESRNVDVTVRNLRGAATEARGTMLEAGMSEEKNLRQGDLTLPENPQTLSIENPNKSPFAISVFAPENDPRTLPYTLRDEESGGRVNLGAWVESLKTTQESLATAAEGTRSSTAGYGAPENDEDEGNKDAPDTQATVDIDKGTRRIRPGLANFTAKVHHTGDPMAWDPVRNKAYMLRLEPKGMKAVGQQLRSYVDPDTGETHGTSGDVNYWQQYTDESTRPMQSAPQHEWIMGNAEALDQEGNPYTLEKMQDAELYSSKQERQMRDVTNPATPGFSTRAANFLDRLHNLREQSTAVCAQCNTKIRGTSKNNAASGLLAHHVLEHGLSEKAAQDMMRSRQFSDTEQVGKYNE